MKVGITAPIFISHPDHKKYLDLTTKSIVSKDHDIYWLPVINFVAPEFRPTFFAFDHEPEEIVLQDGSEDQSVSKAWNMGLQRAVDLELDYVLVINTDIVFKSNAIDRLVAFAQTHPEALMVTAAEWSGLADLEECPEDENYSEHPHFSCYMVRPLEFVGTMGFFDEHFTPAYCEDGDMHARMALLNQLAYIYGGARFYHFGSRTIKSDPVMWQKNTVTFPQCQQYFLDKWGHPPVNEVVQMRALYFKHPFDDKKMGVNDW